MYQPGGTGLIALPSISKHITQRHVNEIGRWAGITLKMKPNCVNTVLSTYQPPKGQITEGTINVTAQQTQKIRNQKTYHRITTSESRNHLGRRL
jgi:hypothetical protein